VPAALQANYAKPKVNRSYHQSEWQVMAHSAAKPLLAIMFQEAAIMHRFLPERQVGGS